MCLSKKFDDGKEIKQSENSEKTSRLLWRREYQQMDVSCTLFCDCDRFGG